MSLEAEIFAASRSLRVPGAGERRVLAPAAVARLAESSGLPRWRVEAVALGIDVAPVHYLRNLDRFRTEGQIRLLCSTAAVVGRHRALDRVAELLALDGVGTIRILATGVEETALPRAESMARAARNRNASCSLQTGCLALRGGNPAEALRGAAVVAACLEDAADEQLLQFACRLANSALALGGVQEQRGQATLVLPGDPGVALVYRPGHPHLDPRRSAGAPDHQATLMVGSWLAQQMTRVLLGEGETLRGILLFADMATGEMSEYRL